VDSAVWDLGRMIPPQLGGGVWGEGSPLPRKKGNFAFVSGAFWRIFLQAGVEVASMM